jgi:hypothetical protein
MEGFPAVGYTIGREEAQFAWRRLDIHFYTIGGLLLGS